MKLTAELAGKIVNSSMEVLGKNINIMDENGTILASGDRTRIGNFHQGAARVIEAKEIVEINKGDELAGSAPGINLPIEFNRQIIGVVGITGDPDEVRGFGKLVKNSVELMLKESFVLEQLQTETKARERLLHDILRGNLDYDSDIIERAKLLRCEIFFPLVVMVIDLQEIEHISLQQWLGQTPKHEIDLENLLSNAVKHLGYIKNNSSLITSMGKNRIIVLQFIAFKTKHDDKDMMATAVNYASQYLKDLKGAFNVEGSVGIGGMATRMQDISRTYKEACLVLSVANRLSYAGNIHCWQDIGLGLLVETTPSEVVDYFKQRVNLPNLLNSKLVDTFKVFLDCNLCVSEAANKLYIHRNTLAYRLNRIKEITGLDPRNIYDAMHIYLTLLFYNYYSV